MFVEGDFEGDLFGREAAVAEGVGFVDEFDGEDWVGGGEGDGFFDAVWGQ